jgi:hypothetical protein
VAKAPVSTLRQDGEQQALTLVWQGGYLSLQSALLFPDAGIKLVLAQYGVIDLAHPSMYSPVEQRLPAEASAVEKYIKNIKPGAIRLSSIPPAQWELSAAILKEGRHRDLIGSDERLYLVNSLQAAATLPAIWFVQGDSDTLVSILRVPTAQKKANPDNRCR